jgi:hypothetical protein
LYRQVGQPLSVRRPQVSLHEDQVLMRSHVRSRLVGQPLPPLDEALDTH